MDNIEMTTIDKKSFIVKNIDSIDNSSLIISFIKENNIGYSKNKNGIFFNLSCMSKEMTNKLYLFILSLIDREINEKEYFKKCKDYTNILSSSQYEKENLETREYDEISFDKLQMEILSKLI